MRLCVFGVLDCTARGGDHPTRVWLAVEWSKSKSTGKCYPWIRIGGDDPPALSAPAAPTACGTQILQHPNPAEPKTCSAQIRQNPNPAETKPCRTQILQHPNPAEPISHNIQISQCPNPAAPTSRSTCIPTIPASHRIQISQQPHPTGPILLHPNPAAPTSCSTLTPHSCTPKFSAPQKFLHPTAPPGPGSSS